MNKWGKNIKLEIYGTSHGEEIGISIGKIPSGIKLNLKKISDDMEKRRPGFSPLTSQRKEPDEFEIISGVKNGITTGETIKMRIKNIDKKSKDYNSILRPGHVDWAAYLKYGKILPGGGQFSARLTAPIVFAGSIAKQILEKKGITISTKISSIGKILNPTDKQISNIVNKVKMDNDSVGGTIKVIINNPPHGLGNDFFGGVESKLSGIFFSIPAVKGVEFGDGFEMSKMNGSSTNDEIYFNKKTKTLYSKTNHMGGILGGITNGMPIVATLAFKPTASIGKPQHSIDTKTMKETMCSTNGRHDPCVVLRAPIIVENYAALAMLDLLIDEYGWKK